MSDTCNSTTKRKPSEEEFVARCLVAISCLTLCDPMDCTTQSKTKIQKWKKNFVTPS